MSRVTVMPTVHVMVTVMAVVLMPAMAAVFLVSTVLAVAPMALMLITVCLRGMPVGVVFVVQAWFGMPVVCVGIQVLSGRVAVGLAGVSIAVILRFVRGAVGETGLWDLAVLVVSGTLLVRTLVLVLMPLVPLVPVLVLVVTPDTVSRVRVVGFRPVRTVALPVHLRIRKAAPSKFGQPANERGSDLLLIRDLNPCLRSRHTAPDIRDPVASRNTDDHQQVRVGRPGHARPFTPRQFSLDCEAFPRGTRAHSQQNSGPGHRPPYQPAPQLHRNAPSRQA